MTLQIVQITLALPIVAAYGLVQVGVVRLHDFSYLTTNLVCSVGLAVTAVLTIQLGFVITNVLWVVVSTSGLIALARQRSGGDRNADRGIRARSGQAT